MAERGIEDVAEIFEQLAVFGAHHFVVDEDGEVGRAQRTGDGFSGLVGARRITAEIEHAEFRTAEAVDLAGHGVVGRQHDGDAIDGVEIAQRHALVGDAVLQAHHRLGGDAGGPQGAQRGLGILRLHGEKNDVVGPEVDVAGVGVAGKAGAIFAVGRAEEQAIGLDGIEHATAGDADDLVAGENEAGCNGATDGTDAINDKAHEKTPRRERLKRRLAQKIDERCPEFGRTARRSMIARDELQAGAGDGIGNDLGIGRQRIGIAGHDQCFGLDGGKVDGAIGDGVACSSWS